MPFYIYIFFGLAPSIIWLLFYLRKDAHPEPNSMVVKIFFYGMLMGVPAILVEQGLFKVFQNSIENTFLLLIFSVFFGIALVEEGLKYLVVREKVLTNSNFDEPLDVMLYLIIAGLGFAGLENILLLFNNVFSIADVFAVSIFRFIGATFLHALCSGILGYFLALSLLETKNRFRFLTTGFAIAVLLHGIYNFSIITINGDLKLILPLVILAILAVAVSNGFKELKELKSICKI